MSARTYRAAYLAKGERALLVRALRFFMHEQQQLITQAHQKYSQQSGILADVKQHHQKQIDAAAALFERFRTGAINQDPSI